MKNQRIAGIGCFAGPKTLSRVAQKWIHAYTLGQFQSDCLDNDVGFTPSEGNQLLKAILAGELTNMCKKSSIPVDGFQNEKITGFFLEMKDHRLLLSVFAKGIDSKQKRYTASLDAITRIRQKRLN